MNGSSLPSRNPAADFLRTSADLSLESFPANSPDRAAALQAARALVRRLETPIETAFDITINIPTLVVALKVARANDVFSTLTSTSGPKTTAQLTKQGDESLMRRILRHLAAMNFLSEAGPDSWAATRMSEEFARDEIFGAIDFGRISSFPANMALVDFLAGNGYKDVFTKNGSYQAYLGPDATFFGTVMSNPDLRFAFGSMMKGYSSQRQSWTGIFDASALLEGLDSESPILVDIGGSHGQDALRFIAKHPEAKGRVIVQDLPGLVEESKASLAEQGVQAMAHDFFTQQPVEGARIYFFHSILHNWPDEESRQILRKLKPAFKKGYSRLIINELILPHQGANVYSTSMDVLMLALLNARERSETEWRQFLDEEGFEVVNFWHGSGTPEGIVEAVLKS